MTTRHRLLAATAVALLLTAACGSDDTTETSDATNAATGTEAPDDTAAPAAEIPDGGLEVSSVNFDAGTAQLINMGDEPVDLTGHWVCNRPNYAELPAVELAPGDTIEIGVVGLIDAGGEVAIYTSNSFDNSDDMVTYVQWGAGGGRSSVAEQAGVWSGPPAEPAPSGISLTGDPGSAAGWN